jgi:nucleotide-binding universal stress UspA family protein
MDGGARGRRPVLVGVEPAGPSHLAVGWAAELAAAQGAPLHLVHAAGTAVGERQPAWLAELAVTVRRAGADPVLAEVVPGDPASALVARAGGAGMLVLGSFGSGASAGMLAGTVALEVVGRAGCPVAVVRGSAPTAPVPHDGPVVAGVDASASSRAALLLAADLAAALGTGLVAVHARPAGAAGPPGEAVLDEEVAAVTAVHPGLEVGRELADDTPLRPLLRRAESARLLVVGQRGRAVVPTMRQLGSTSRALVEFAPCPVVVAPPGA